MSNVKENIETALTTDVLEKGVDLSSCAIAKCAYIIGKSIRRKIARYLTRAQTGTGTKQRTDP